MPENAIAIIGVGYVGLPLAIGLANHHGDIIAFDIDRGRIEELNAGIDRNDPLNLKKNWPKSLSFSCELDSIKIATTYIVTVPTPIDINRLPDLSVLENSCRKIARVIGVGDLVIVESTVYPGVTEEVCGPLIEEVSGLRQGQRLFFGLFTRAYKPRRF